MRKLLLAGVFLLLPLLGAPTDAASCYSCYNAAPTAQLCDPFGSWATECGQAYYGFELFCSTYGDECEEEDCELEA